MALNKKGTEFDPFKIAAAIVLIFLVLLLLLGILGKGFNIFRTITKCEDRGGRSVSGGGCPDGEYELTGLQTDNPGDICCKLYEVTPGTAAQGLDSKQQTAVDKAFTLKVDNSKAITDRSTITLKVGKTYNLPMTFNSKLITDTKLGLKEEIGYCAIYVTDSRDNNKKYVFSSTGGLEVAPAEAKDMKDKKELFECEKITAVTYKPTQEDVYKDLTLYIILLDKETQTAYDDGAKDNYNLFNSLYISQNWLTSDIFRIKVESLVKVSGLSGEWVAKDDITVSCEDLTCTKFEFKLVNAETATKKIGTTADTTDFEALVKSCNDGSYFATDMYYVSGTTTKTTGVPLNIDLGGFRLPSQQKIQYTISRQDMTVINNKVNVIIDRGTMLKSFYEKNEDPNTIIGQKTHLCVKATLKDSNPVYVVSSEPLKVDIMPPIVNAEQIKVVYPDPIQSLDKATPYYYRQYPRVVITNCYDYGQSGCSNYDYYIHTGNFVNLRSSSADWQTGVVGLFLTEGLNSLLGYFTSQDAGNTLCPYILGPGYIRNSNTEIRFMDQGQGIICLKVGDKAGNFDLVWKELWTPQEMFGRIIADEANEFIDNTVN